MAIIGYVKRYAKEQFGKFLQPQQMACNSYAVRGFAGIINDGVDSINAARHAFKASHLCLAQEQHEYRRAFERLIAFHRDLPYAQECRKAAYIPDMASIASVFLYNKRIDAMTREDMPHEDIAFDFMFSFDRSWGVNKLINSVRKDPDIGSPFLAFLLTAALLGGGTRIGGGIGSAVRGGIYGAGVVMAIFVITAAHRYYSKRNSEVLHVSPSDL